MEDIRKVSNTQLLEWYKHEVKRRHYDPTDSFEHSLFEFYELEREIKRRMSHYDFIL